MSAYTYVWDIEIVQRRDLQVLERAVVTASSLAGAVRKGEQLRRRNWRGVAAFVATVKCTASINT